jgi:hypothetical protein
MLLHGMLWSLVKVSGACLGVLQQLSALLAVAVLGVAMRLLFARWLFSS